MTLGIYCCKLWTTWCSGNKHDRWTFTFRLAKSDNNQREHLFYLENVVFNAMQSHGICLKHFLICLYFITMFRLYRQQFPHPVVKLYSPIQSAMYLSMCTIFTLFIQPKISTITTEISRCGHVLFHFYLVVTFVQVVAFSNTPLCCERCHFVSV